MPDLESFKKQALDELIEWLRIPSISTAPEHKADVQKAADFAEAALRRAGMTRTEQISRATHPLVFAEWLGAPGKPTLLLYGHYDVQPVDPIEEWKSAPFEPEIRNNNIYARGATDDKGQTLILLKAVEYLMLRDGKLPINIKFLLEGEEEIGGEAIERYVSEKPAQLAADAAIICDTEMFCAGLPTICTGLRGMVYGELHVEGARQDLHSGVYGGVAPNPIMAIAEILCALKDKDGHIHVDGLYDRVQPPAEAEKAAWASLAFNEEEYLEKELGSTALTGEPGFSVFDKTWARPTLEVHGIRGGFVGDGAKTVIPARAVAKISMRLVADQRPEEAIEQLKAAIAKVTPKGVRVEFKFLHGAAPSLTDPDNKFIQESALAMEEVFGKKTVYIRSGGSVPIVGLFQKHLGFPSVLMGFGLPDDNLHSPNEKFHLPNFYQGIDAVIRYLERLGA
jgi:acetylornithine deacetylase/succinyl-diaminopimelate desuccinylase-like protein